MGYHRYPRVIKDSDVKDGLNDYEWTYTSPEFHMRQVCNNITSNESIVKLFYPFFPHVQFVQLMINPKLNVKTTKIDMK